MVFSKDAIEENTEDVLTLDPQAGAGEAPKSMPKKGK
jgi:hypothetical protein